ncbi:hypothetical protein RQP46_004111 [Phenoliferia psychrophenolica]
MATRVVLATPNSPYASLTTHKIPEFVRSESQESQERAYLEIHAAATASISPGINVAETSVREQEIASALEWLAVQREEVSTTERR